MSLLFFLGGGGDTPGTQVRKTINAFAEAVDTANGPKMLSLMCAAEAQQVKDGEDYEPNDDSTIDPGRRRPVDITEMKISGDTATATVTRPPDGPRSYRLVKEAGGWKMCDPGPVTTRP